MKTFTSRSSWTLAGEEHLLGCSDAVLVALSGGRRLTALLAALAELRTPARCGEVTALHVDHGLRAGSHARRRGVCAAVRSGSGVPLPPGEGRGARRATCRRRRGGPATPRCGARRPGVGATRIATGHTRTTRPRRCSCASCGAPARAGCRASRRGAAPSSGPLIDRTRAEVIAYVAGARPAPPRGPDQRHPALPAQPGARRGAPGPPVAGPARVARGPGAGRRPAARRRARARRPGTASRGGRRRCASPTCSPSRVAVRRRVVRDLWRRAAGRRRRPRGAPRRVGAGAARPARAVAARPCPGGFEACVRYGALAVAAPRRRRRPPPSRSASPGRARTRCPAGGVLEVGCGDGRGLAALVARAGGPATASARRAARRSKKLKAWLIDRKVPREVRDALRVLADDAGWVLWHPGTGRPVGEAERRRPLPRVSPRDSASAPPIPDCAGAPALLYWDSDVANGEDPGKRFRKLRQSYKTVLLWVVLILMFVALLPVLRPARPRAEGVRLLRLHHQGRGG